MQQFVVPQFITVENKILGPIDSRQFVFLMVGMALLFIEYKTLGFLQSAVAGIITIALTAAFAFVKVNGKPFHAFLANILQTLGRPHVRVWDSSWQLKVVTVEKGKHEIQHARDAERAPAKHMAPSKHLSDISLIVDTGGVYEGEK